MNRRDVITMVLTVPEAEELHGLLLTYVGSLQALSPELLDTEDEPLSLLRPVLADLSAMIGH